MLTFLTAALMTTTFVLASPPQDTVEKKVRIVVPKVQRFDMEGAIVDGKSDGPSIASFVSRAPSQFSPMIQERANFKSELLNGLDKI